MKLPANLPSVRNARLPATYEKAKDALAKCAQIDECQTWAKKAEALASYAKQAEDDTLRKMADRIQARAIRRCGELLKAIKPGKGSGAPNVRGGVSPDVSRTRVARAAGLSVDQRKTALRVASVPTDEFEAAVESEEPPTVTQLAERGKATRPLLDLQGRDPEEFARSTEGQGHIRRLAEFAEKTEPGIVVRGAFPNERKKLRQEIISVLVWLGALADMIREAEE